MRYEKPEVMEIDARPAAGQQPEVCASGEAADLPWQTCGVGTGAGWSCVLGVGGGTRTSCVPGGAADYDGDCYSGTVVNPGNWCEVGTNGGQDLYGCTVGPSFT